MIQGSLFVLLNRYSGGQIEEDVMGGACGTYVGKGGAYMVFLGKFE